MSRHMITGEEAKWFRKDIKNGEEQIAFLQGFLKNIEAGLQIAAKAEYRQFAIIDRESLWELQFAMERTLGLVEDELQFTEHEVAELKKTYETAKRFGVKDGSTWDMQNDKG